MKIDLFVKKLEEIDKYINHEENNIVLLMLEQMRAELINMQMEDNMCEHTKYVDEGYYSYENNTLQQSSKEEGKYHIVNCAKCNKRICLINNKKNTNIK